MTLYVYDFEIFYKSEKTNFVNESSKRLNYEKTLMLNIKFLSSLQSKLALSKCKIIMRLLPASAPNIKNMRRIKLNSNNILLFDYLK